MGAFQGHQPTNWFLCAAGTPDSLAPKCDALKERFLGQTARTGQLKILQFVKSC